MGTSSYASSGDGRRYREIVVRLSGGSSRAASLWPAASPHLSAGSVPHNRPRRINTHEADTSGHSPPILVVAWRGSQPVHGGASHRWKFQQRRILLADDRRLQHQRQPLGREHHLRGWGRGLAHPLHGRDHRRPERRYRPGSSGPDGQLHARIWTRERGADPLHFQERQQPLLGQRIVLLARRVAAS